MQVFNWKNFFAKECQDDAVARVFEKITYPWEALLLLEEFFKSPLMGKLLGKISPHAFIENPESVYVAPSAVIEPFVYIQGPCFIGEGAIIRQGAYLRNGVYVSSGCVVGHTTEVKSSILLNKASCGHFNYVGDSILGQGVNLGAGAKCANLRLDRRNVFVRGPNDEKIDSGLKKLGAIIGDGAQVGCNAVLNPGTLMGKEAFCLPLSNVGGFVGGKSFIKKVN